jgi:hypothetical protein
MSSDLCRMPRTFVDIYSAQAFACIHTPGKPQAVLHRNPYLSGAEILDTNAILNGAGIGTRPPYPRQPQIDWY